MKKEEVFSGKGTLRVLNTDVDGSTVVFCYKRGSDEPEFVPVKMNWKVSF